MSWELILHVVGAGRLYAHVVEKTFIELIPLEQTVKVPSQYAVKFLGVQHQWGVVRKGVPLKDGFSTEALANRYAANHESAVER